METVLRILGFILVLLAIGCLILGLGEEELLATAPSLLIAGVVLLALSAILERLGNIEMLLRPPDVIARGDRVKTGVGDFQILKDVEGEAMCLGCRKVSARAGLYYNKSLDVYYHPECLAKDRK